MAQLLKAQIRLTTRMINLGPQKKLRKKRKIRRKSAKGNVKGEIIAQLPPKVIPLRS